MERDIMVVAIIILCVMIVFESFNKNCIQTNTNEQMSTNFTLTCDESVTMNNDVESVICRANVNGEPIDFVCNVKTDTYNMAINCF